MECRLQSVLISSRPLMWPMKGCITIKRSGFMKSESLFDTVNAWYAFHIEKHSMLK